jgi:hypothetical protein
MALELDVDPLPENSIPLRVVVLIETLSADGTRELEMRTSKDNMVWDNIGMLETALAQERLAAVEGWEPQ